MWILLSRSLVLIVYPPHAHTHTFSFHTHSVDGFPSVLMTHMQSIYISSCFNTLLKYFIIHRACVQHEERCMLRIWVLETAELLGKVPWKCLNIWYSTSTRSKNLLAWASTATLLTQISHWSTSWCLNDELEQTPSYPALNNELKYILSRFLPFKVNDFKLTRDHQLELHTATIDDRLSSPLETDNRYDFKSFVNGRPIVFLWLFTSTYFSSDFASQFSSSSENVSPNHCTRLAKSPQPSFVFKGCTKLIWKQSCIPRRRSLWALGKPLYNDGFLVCGFSPDGSRSPFVIVSLPTNLPAFSESSTVSEHGCPKN